MSQTTDLVSRHTRNLLIEGLSRYGFEETAEFLEKVWLSSTEQNESNQVSRQAAHARFYRALSMAYASCIFLSSEDKKYEDLMFDPDYCRLRPYRDETYNKTVFLFSKGILGSAEGWERIWHRASEYYINVGKQIGACPDEDLLIANNCIALMGGAVIMLGETIRDDWKKLWLKAKRYGVLENPFFHLNLALVGHYAGSSEALIEWLLDDSNKKCETADILTFVRHDHTEELNNLVIRIMRDDLPTPTECLFHPKPASTMNFTVDFIKRFTRMARHFSHPSMILMLLNYTEIASNLYTSWKNEDRFDARDRKSIEKRFEQLERVQFMEKNRFFEVAGALPPGKLRNRLFDLWKITYN